MRYGQNLSEVRSNGQVLFITLAILGLIFIGWLWVTQTTFETLNEIGTGWYGPGVPIIETQLLIAWAAGMVMFAFLVLATRVTKRSGSKHWLQPRTVDILIGITLWLITIVVWQSTPLVTSWFVTEPTHPNYEYYPNSDAFRLDRTSQAHLVGEGFRDFTIGTHYIRKPLLSIHLSLLHLIGGQDYQTVVGLQIVVLALLPTLIYALTSSIHNRISAVIAAVLIMLRESNSIAIADTITASHAKLLMSDLPTQFLMVCLTISAVAWVKRIDRNSIFPLICGGTLGLTILIRNKSALLLLPLVAIAGIILLPRKRPMAWLKNVLLLTLGMSLIVTPWLYRTWKLTGHFTIDPPSFYLKFLNYRSKSIQSELQPSPTLEDFDQQSITAPVATFNSQATPQITITPPNDNSTPIAEIDRTNRKRTPTDPLAVLPNRFSNFLSRNLRNNGSYLLSYYLRWPDRDFLNPPNSF